MHCLLTAWKGPGGGKPFGPALLAAAEGGHVAVLEALCARGVEADGKSLRSAELAAWATSLGTPPRRP